MHGSWRIALGVMVIGLWSARCGSTAQGSGSTGGPDGGPVANADAGAGGDAGSGGTDGGTSADGGIADGGGGSPDAGGGGGVAAGCEGVVPDRLGSSFTFEVPGFTFPGADWTCDSDTSDESGNLASHVVYGKTYTTQRWHLFDSNGAHRAEFYALDLFPQGSGFEGIFEDSAGDRPLFKVALWTPDGKRSDGAVLSGDIVPSGLRAWPNGLLTLIPFCHFNDGREDITLRRFDPSLNELARANVTLTCVAVAGAAEDANRNLLLLVSGTGASAQGYADDDLVGYWFDSDRKPLTGWFRVGAGGATGHKWLVHALIGGGAAVQIDGVWTYFIPSGKAEAQPAPGFLADNPGADFTLVRGAKAYAVLPRAGDTTQMKLYSSGGDLCGTVRFPSGSLTTGADGSAIASSGGRGCTKTVWPGLLR